MLTSCFVNNISDYTNLKKLYAYEVAGSVLLNKKFDMRNLLFLTIATVLFNGCHTESEKKNTMDSAKKNNPAYSKSDSSEVVLNDDEWKKILSPEVYYVARKKGTERHGQADLINFQKVAPIIVQFAEMHFLKVIPSLKVAADGRAFMNL